MDKYTIRNSDNGQIDIAASTNEYAKALAFWISTNEADQEKISDAVNATLDKFNKLPMEMLITQSVQAISEDPTQFKNIEKRVKAYIKSQVDSNILISKRGRQPGVSRVENKEIENMEAEIKEAKSA